jgi:hypothetical protein
MVGAESYGGISAAVAYIPDTHATKTAQFSWKPAETRRDTEVYGHVPSSFPATEKAMCNDLASPSAFVDSERKF